MASKNQYVDNQEFFKALVEYKRQAKEASDCNLPVPQIPDFIGSCILKIAEHLSYKPNFMSYPFREDMVGDAIENAFQYLLNFDPEKSQNPFAYFTQIMWYAFLRRIFREKKQLYVKYKMIQNSNEFTDFVNQPSDDKEYHNTYIAYLRENMGEIITEFEDKKKNKKVKKNLNSLERFFPVDELPMLPKELVEEIGEPISIEEVTLDDLEEII